MKVVGSPRLSLLLQGNCRAWLSSGSYWVASPAPSQGPASPFMLGELSVDFLRAFW